LNPVIERPRGELDERVLVCLVGGTIKYVGPVHWSKVSHVGIVLDKPVGDIDGEVGGVRYFSCGPNQGWMEPLAELTCRGNWRPATVKQKAAAKTVGKKAATAKQKVAAKAAAKTIGQKAATAKQKVAAKTIGQKAATAKQKVAAKTIGQKAATPKQKSAVAASNQKRKREEPKNKLCGIVSSGLIRKCGRSKA
jgi:dynactin complex subunit